VDRNKVRQPRQRLKGKRYYQPVQADKARLLLRADKAREAGMAHLFRRAESHRQPLETSFYNGWLFHAR
jgi:hypothetical protein